MPVMDCSATPQAQSCQAISHLPALMSSPSRRKGLAPRPLSATPRRSPSWKLRNGPPRQHRRKRPEEQRRANSRGQPSHGHQEHAKFQENRRPSEGPGRAINRPRPPQTGTRQRNGGQSGDRGPAERPEDDGQAINDREIEGPRTRKAVEDREIETTTERSSGSDRSAR